MNHPALANCELFAHMQPGEIEKILRCAAAQVKSYARGEIIFHQWDQPRCIYVLLQGAVSVCRDHSDGRRSILTAITRSGDLFGEVYVFYGGGAYDAYTLATVDTQVLALPREFFYNTCPQICDCHLTLIHNMLAILARKAHTMQQKLQLLSSGTLRQKIANYLLTNTDPEGWVTLDMNREALADFLHVTRPSLSRTLLQMQEEGLIRLTRSQIYIPNAAALEQLLN